LQQPQQSFRELPPSRGAPYQARIEALWTDSVERRNDGLVHGEAPLNQLHVKAIYVLLDEVDDLLMEFANIANRRRS
jgi:hypothetical protein